MNVVHSRGLMTASDDLSTSALFEVSHGRYDSLLRGAVQSQASQSGRHVYAMPPATRPYLTQCGVMVDALIR